LVFYALIIGLATPASLPLIVKISFWLFALYIFWTIKSENPKFQISNFKFSKWLFVPFVVLLIIRLIPFIRWQGVIPLGADAGVYLRVFSNLPPAFTYLSYLAFIIFIAIALYLFTKEYLGKEAAFFSLLIYSLSAPQFLAYFAFYWRMALAMALTLFSFHLIEKKSWWIIPVAGFMGAFHIVSYIPLFLAYILKTIFNRKRRYFLLSGLGTLLVAFALNWKNFISYLPYYTEKFGLIRGYSAELTYTLTGHFINFELYRTLFLIYLPFSLIGILIVIHRKKINNIAFFYLLANLLMVVGGFIFHNRFIVHLDLALIIFAGLGLYLLINHLWPTITGKITISVLLIAMASTVGYLAWFTEPYITDPAEIAEMKIINSSQNNAETIFTTNNLYRPYLRLFIDSKKIINEIDYNTSFYLHTDSETKMILHDKDPEQLKQVGKRFWLWINRD